MKIKTSVQNFQLGISQIRVVLSFGGPSIACKIATYDSFCQIGSHIVHLKLEVAKLLLHKVAV